MVDSCRRSDILATITIAMREHRDMKTQAERKEKLNELIARFGDEAVRAELGVSELTMEKYQADKPQRMAPWHKLVRTEMRLSK